MLADIGPFARHRQLAHSSRPASELGQERVGDSPIQKGHIAIDTVGVIERETLVGFLRANTHSGDYPANGYWALPRHALYSEHVSAI